MPSESRTIIDLAALVRKAAAMIPARGFRLRRRRIAAQGVLQLLLGLLDKGRYEVIVGPIAGLVWDPVRLYGAFSQAA